MSETAREEFLAGKRPDDVLIFFAAHALSDPEVLAEHGELREEGVVMVLPGEQGRAMYEKATGVDPMTFAQRAMGTDGDIGGDLFSATCPRKWDEESDDDHQIRNIFAFAEEQNEEVGGLYAEGDVIHAYAHCTCDAAYSDRWVAGDREF